LEGLFYWRFGKMIMRYVENRRPPEYVTSEELDRVIAEYHRILDARRREFNLQFAGCFRPFNWEEPEKERRRRRS